MRFVTRTRHWREARRFLAMWGRQGNAATESGGAYDGHAAARCAMSDLVKIIIAVLLPPVGVFLEVGFGAQFWLNILLTLLGYIPGIIHAVYIIATR